MKYTYTTTVVRIAAILGIVVLLALGVVWRGDFFGSTFATNTGTGALELKIDNQTFYNGALQPTLSWSLKNLVPSADKFFNFTDVKPGDTGTTTMSIHLKNSSAYVCLDFKNLKDSENGINEPEGLVDVDEQGELSGELEFFAWRDDGDNTFEVGEKPLFGTSSQSAIVVLNETTYALSDATHGPAFPVNQTKYVGVAWCAGNLSVNLLTAQIECDATAMGNEAQTDQMEIDVSVRAVSSTQQPKFTCVPPPVPVDTCEIEGHKYDQNGQPLPNWTIGLSKSITHNKGIDVYDLATDVTDSNGYYCLKWNGESRTLRGVSTYVSGPYSFTYYVYEKMVTGWKNISIEKGPNVASLTVVLNQSIIKSGGYVSVKMGETNGYIYGNAAYHIDFYNQRLSNGVTGATRGNNGHGNDSDANDDSNPGKSNNTADTTDDDGKPGKQKISGSASFYLKKNNPLAAATTAFTRVLKKVQRNKES